MTLKPAKHKYPWSFQDEVKLRELCAESLPLQEIAQRLKRTENAIRSKIRTLGLLAMTRSSQYESESARSNSGSWFKNWVTSGSRTSSSGGGGG